MVEGERTDSNLMDIVTHAGIGLIAAAPWLDSQPELALGLVAGSVLPDLDALSRVFGKRAFLHSHQTWSHALPIQAVVAALARYIAGKHGANGALLGAGLFVGFAIHTLLDLSNSVGVTVFAAFSRNWFLLEWVFFIYSFVLTLTAVATVFILWQFVRNGGAPAWCSGLFLGAMAVYFGTKGILRKRAGNMASDAVSLIPSALCPWRFFGVMVSGNQARFFRINAVTGIQETLVRQKIIDTDYAKLLAEVPEFQLMRGLSPAYHVISTNKIDAGEAVVCRDLRTRNYKTTFGDLEILLDANKNVIRTTFHV